MASARNIPTGRTICHKDLLKSTYELQVRCAKGIKPELVHLVELEGVGRVRARGLYNAGYKTLEELKRVSISDLMNVPMIACSGEEDQGTGRWYYQGRGMGEVQIKDSRCN